MIGPPIDGVGSCGSYVNVDPLPAGATAAPRLPSSAGYHVRGVVGGGQRSEVAPLVGAGDVHPDRLRPWPDVDAGDVLVSQSRTLVEHHRAALRADLDMGPRADGERDVEASLLQPL